MISNILNAKKMNDNKAQLCQKQVELKRLKSYSHNLEKLIQEKFASDKSIIDQLNNQNDAMERKVLIEEMTTATLCHMLSRDKLDLLAKFKPMEKLK